MSLNKVMLIGNVGKDPEIRYLEGNSANGQNAKVASFPLATSERYRDRNGEQHENTEWHNIVAWRGLADTMERFVTKGTQLYIEGKLRTRKWQDQTGAQRYTTEVIADVIQLLGRRQDNPGAQGGYQGGQGGFQGGQGGFQGGQGGQGGFQGSQGGYQQRPQQGGYQSQPAGFQGASQPAGFQGASQPAGFQSQQPSAPDYSADAPTDDLPF